MPPLEITRRHGRTLHPHGVRPPEAPAWVDAIDNPYLHGVFAPVVGEATADDLAVDGQLPRDLNGAYFRNGPNSRLPPLNRYHWFDGDGMVHGLWFEDGAVRYRRRYVRTRGFDLEREHGAAIWPGVLGPFDDALPGGPLKDTANTDLVALSGHLYALWYESGELVGLDPRSLDTTGVPDLQARIGRPVSAHSRVDPATGDFLFFGYGDRPPYMHYGVVRPDGTVHHTDITLPGPRRPHDMGVTANHTILHDFPVFFDPASFARTGKRVPLFHPEVPTRFGVIPRFGTDADTRWFGFEPCYMLHVVNCWEAGSEIVMIGCRNDDPSLHPDPRDGRIAAMLSGLRLRANLYEWRMDLATGATAERKLDDLNLEFPTIAPTYAGRRNRYAYLSRIPWDIPLTFDGLVKHDLETGHQERYDYGPGVFGSEAAFAPRPGASAEDDGYLVTFVTDTNDWSSACLVFDATDIPAGPIATVRVPHRIPAGFHATWMDAAQLG